MYEDIASIINDAAERGIYKKTVLSKCTDKSVKRCTVSMFRHCGGGTGIQLETLLRDGKAVHKNLPQEELISSVLSLLGLYRQADIITTAGSCTVMISERGKVHVKNTIKAGEAELAEIQGHDRKKTHLLSPDAPFLYPRVYPTRTADCSTADSRSINRSTAFWSCLTMFTLSFRRAVHLRFATCAAEKAFSPLLFTVI